MELRFPHIKELSAIATEFLVNLEDDLSGNDFSFSSSEYGMYARF